MGKRKSRDDIDNAVTNIMKYAGREAWCDQLDDTVDSAMNAAAQDLAMDADEVAELLEESELWPMAFGFLFEWFATRRLREQPNSLLDDYLKRRGWQESPRGRRYLQAMNSSPITLWEVVNVKPGSYLDVRVHGEQEKPVRVYEKAGSRDLKRWSCLAARVIELDGKRVFTGAMLPLPPDYAQDVDDVIADYIADAMEAFQEAEEGAAAETGANALDAEQLRELSILVGLTQYPEALFVAWLRCVEESMTGFVPELATMEGDAIEPATVRFPVQEEHREQVIQRLQQAPGLVRDGEAFNWRWLADTEDRSTPEETIVLGMIELSAKGLSISVFSRSRAERGKQYLADLLHGLVGAPLTAHQTMESMLDESPEPTASAEPEDEALTEAELRALANDHLDKHYHRVIDEPLPMLDRRTPRECAKDPDMRDEVILWIKVLENRTAGSPNDDYDFGWMWEELGVADSR